jgi:phosphoglycerate dehydrogenase-like enzyme
MTFGEYKQNPIPKVEYIFSTWGMPVLTEEEIASYFPDLKAVFYAAGTVQSFVKPFLASGVRVFSAWAANGVPVAEFTVAQIVLANKGYFKMPGLYKKHGYKAAAEFSSHFAGNYNALVGLLGAGMIGRLVIKMLRVYNMEVWVFDPFLPDEQAKELGVKKVSLADIFRHCDVISNHLANNEQTQGMLDYSLFADMKEYATFINTGRGGQINKDDFLKAMKEKPNCTALLDVTDPEEPLPTDSDYFSCDNIYITPHRAGSVNNEIVRMGIYMFDEYKRLVSGETPLYEVHTKMLETLA